MPQASPELGRKKRKQLATFKGELARRGIHTADQLAAFTGTLPREKYELIVGLIPHVFSKPNGGATRPS